MMQITLCDNPVFVLGAPRSGTSMMQWALRQHPELWGGQESDFLVPLVADLRREFEAGSARGRLHWLSGQGVAWEEFLMHVGRGINSLYMSRSGGKRWVEQTPQYTHHLADMAVMFPGSQFVYMVRDGRSVVASLRRFVTPVPHTEACHIWRASVESGLAFRETSAADRLLAVPYEAVVDETEAEMARIFEFLGLDPHPDAVAFIRKGAPINSSFRSDPNAAAGKPRWADWTIDERREFHDIAGHLLVELGLEDDDGWVEAGLAPAGAEGSTT